MYPAQKIFYERISLTVAAGDCGEIFVKHGVNVGIAGEFKAAVSNCAVRAEDNDIALGRRRDFINFAAQIDIDGFVGVGGKRGTVDFNGFDNVFLCAREFVIECREFIFYPA